MAPIDQNSPSQSQRPDLYAVPIFEGVPADTMALISEDMVGCFPTGAEIVREGDAAAGLIILLHGEARVISDGTYIAARTAGEIIGEQAILDRTQRSATVIADGMVKALVVPRRVVDCLLKDATF